MATIEAGTIIAGKYHVERQLSQGGMGSVWIARQIQLQRRVVIKLMEPSLAATAQGRARFEREAQAAALIQSPHVVQIHDYGVERDTPYIVMELLEGEDLGRRLKRERRLPLTTVANIFGQITKALRKAHEAGMMHLDLKPANIFLARDDEDDIVKVLDFGIAKMITTAPDTEVTATGVVLGSVHYMSPEQVRGRRGLDHRSDLWSLGVIAFRAITGELPFGGTQVGDVLVKVCADPIPIASTVAPGISPEVDAFLLRALTRDPDGRFQSAREFAAALALLAWPGEPRAPQASIASGIAPVDAPRVVVKPPAATAKAALVDPSIAATQELFPAAPQSSSASWTAPPEAGTLTSVAGASALAATMERGSRSTRPWKTASLAAFGIVSIVAAGVIGSAALSAHRRTTPTIASTIPAAAPPDESAPRTIPALAPTAREVEVEPPPQKTSAPVPSTAPSARATPTASPSAVAPIKPAGRPPPVAPTPKKPNPALGF